MSFLIVRQAELLYRAAQIILRRVLGERNQPVKLVSSLGEQRACAVNSLAWMQMLMKTSA